MAKAMETLDKTLAEHKPYAIIIADGTGINPNGDSELYSVTVQSFAYSEQEGKYQPDKHFEQLIQTSAEETRNINFEKIGIKKQDYESNAVSKSTFSNAFQQFVMEELNLEETTFVAAGRDGLCMEFLDKTEGAAEPFKDTEKSFLPSVEITKDFLEEHGKNGSSNVQLHRFLYNGDSRPDSTAEGKLNLYNEMISRHCAEHHLLETKTETKTAEQVEQPKIKKQETAKAQPEDNFIFDPSVEEVSDFEATIPKMPESMTEHFRKEDEAYREYLSEKGKKEYREGNIAEKSDILARTGALDKEAVLDESSDCDLHRLQAIMSGSYDRNDKCNEGFFVLQVGTTGIGTMGRGDKTGYPMQISLQHFQIDKENGGLERDRNVHMIVPVDKSAIEKAIQNADEGKFDTFRHGGLDREEYLRKCAIGENDANSRFYTMEKAVRLLEMTFQQFPVETNPIISAGRVKGKENSFGQESLKYVFNNPALDSVSVDFTQVIKEYAFAVSEGKFNGKNVMIPEGKSPENFKMESIAALNGQDIAGAKEKCFFMAEIIEKMNEQRLELEKDKQTEKKAPVPEKKTSFTEQEIPISKPNISREKPVAAEQPVRKPVKPQPVRPQGQPQQPTAQWREPEQPSVRTPERKPEPIAPQYSNDNNNIIEIVNQLNRAAKGKEEPRQAVQPVQTVVEKNPQQEPMIPLSVMKEIFGEMKDMFAEALKPVVESLQTLTMQGQSSGQIQMAIANGTLKIIENTSETKETAKCQLAESRVANENQNAVNENIQQGIENSTNIIQQMSKVVDYSVRVQEGLLETNKAVVTIADATSKTAVHVSEHDVNQNELRQQVTKNTSEIKGLNQKIAESKAEIEEVKKDIADVRSNLDSVQRNFKKGMEETNKKVGESNKRIGNLMTELMTEFSAQRDENDARNEQYQKMFETIIDNEKGLDQRIAQVAETVQQDDYQKSYYNDLQA